MNHDQQHLCLHEILKQVVPTSYVDMLPLLFILVLATSCTYEHLAMQEAIKNLQGCEGSGLDQYPVEANTAKQNNLCITFQMKY